MLTNPIRFVITILWSFSLSSFNVFTLIDFNSGDIASDSLVKKSSIGNKYTLLFNFDIDEYESISNVEIDSKEETYSDLIKSNIEKTLADADYKNSKVKVTVKLKDDELYIQSADIYILDDYDSKEVKDFLFEKLGINAKVYYIGE